MAKKTQETPTITRKRKIKRKTAEPVKSQTTYKYGRLEPYDNSFLTFGRMNYIFLIAGILTILVGLIVMGMEDAQYGFGPLALTVAPIIIAIGFVLEFVAIFYPRKEDTPTKEEASKE